MAQGIQIGLLGLGTVGQGTAKVLTRNATEIARRAGHRISVAGAVVRHPENYPDMDFPVTSDSRSLLENPDIDIIVELVGGYEPARSMVLQALENDKHVVTANKALIALHGTEIFAAAQNRGLMVAFEAAVSGGIPVIKAIREGLAGNRIEWLAGIINGTCNYMLTQMQDHNREFDDVLAEAQRLGYAEADPGFDIDGIDAAHKLTILAAVAFGIPLQFDRVYCEGIGRISRQDVRYADELGYRIKHLGIAKNHGDSLELRVHPTLTAKRSLLSNVDDVMNAVMIKGDAVGSTLYYGPGAGSEPTASAVVADIIDVVRGLDTQHHKRIPHLAFQPDALSDLPIQTIGDCQSSYYLRLAAADRTGVLADIAGILANADINIEAIIQKQPETELADIILLTHPVIEHRIDSAIVRMESLPGVNGKVTRIRLEHF